MQPLALGVDQLLLRFADFENKKIAFVCNEASMTSTGIPSRVALLNNGFKLSKLFSPEHGIESVGEDGRYIPNGVDKLTGLPIISLYGDKLMPSAEDLADIDLVVIDLPDIGCRFYTYLWTMTYVLEACEHLNMAVLICDRPNAIIGNLAHAEGPFLDEENCSSFIGRWSIPLKHACTFGELAQYFKHEKLASLNLEIIKMQGWDRNRPDKFTFYPTSPAIQRRATAYLYPGTGLLEGINVNEGRGTQHPFEQFGTPFINSEQVLNKLSVYAIDHLEMQICSYIPQGGLYSGETCYGLQFRIKDETLFQAVAFGIIVLQVLLELYPNQIKERLYDTIANPSGKAHLDKLLGIENALEKLKDKSFKLEDIHQQWADKMHQHLLY